MASKVNQDLVRQEIEKGRMGDRELAKKPGETPRISNEDDGSIVLDEDQRQVVANQDEEDAAEAERNRQRPI